MPGSSVVLEMIPITEPEFRAAMLSGLSRCARTPAGKRALAVEMDLSTKALDNILLKGAVPGPKRLWDARRAHPSALDDVASLYGCKIVSTADGDSTSDVGTLPIAMLLARVAEAESPTSPGGTKKTHGELLAMEAEIRAVQALTSDWIERINSVRSKPPVVSG